MNFDDFSRKLKEFGQNTIDEVQKMNDVRQLNSQISAERKKINSVYAEIGRKLFHLYKEAPLAEFESEIQSLKDSFNRIDDIQGQIRTVKGLQLCPHCKSEVSLEETFCPNCGSRLPRHYTVEDAEVIEQENDGSLEYQAGIREETVASEQTPENTEAAAPAGEEACGECADSSIAAEECAEAADPAGEESCGECEDSGVAEDSAEAPAAADEQSCTGSADCIAAEGTEESSGSADSALN